MTKIRKYTLVFFLTALIFAIAWSISANINKRKFTNLRQAQDQAAIDILASETKFDLSHDTTCNEDESVVFENNMAKIADKIAYAEQNVGTSEEIMMLKKQYSLLEVRDFLLNKRANERCKIKTVNIFYFYGTKVECPDCIRQGYVLDAIRQKRQNVRVYAFDYSLDLSTIEALREIYGIANVPALVIDGVTYNGYQSLERLLVFIPEEAQEVENI